MCRSRLPFGAGEGLLHLGGVVEFQQCREMNFGLAHGIQDGPVAHFIFSDSGNLFRHGYMHVEIFLVEGGGISRSFIKDD